MVAIQDGVTKTKAYRSQILKESVDPTCGLCGGGGGGGEYLNQLCKQPVPTDLGAARRSGGAYGKGGARATGGESQE